MLNKVLLIILIINDVSTSSSTDVSEKSGSKFNSLVKCIVEVTKIDVQYKPTVILEYKSNKTSGESDFLMKMISTLQTNNIPQLILDDRYEIKNKIKASAAGWFVVLYYANCESLSDLKIDIFAEKIKYLIIINDFVVNVCNEDAIEVGNNIMMYDVTFIIGDPDQYRIATFIPEIEEVSCKRTVTKATVLNICSNGTIDKKTSFPAKTPMNFNKCPLNVGMSTLYPLSIIDNKEDMKTYDKITEVKGSDFEVIKIITRELNSSLKMYFVAKAEENPFGQLDFLPFIMNGSLDIMAGGFYRIYGDSVEYSGVYAVQAVFWFYTAHRETRSWQNFVKKVKGLYIFFIFYVIYSVIWYIVSKFDKQTASIKNTLLYAWGALVGTSSLEYAKTTKQKILNLVYLIMCLHLSAYISIKFYSFLTILGPPELIYTNEDLMASGRIPYLRNPAKYFVTDDKYTKFANTSIDCDSFWDCSRQSLINKGITVLLQSYFTFFQANSSINDEATVLRVPENLLTVYDEMLIRKGSPYVKKVQNILQRLLEAGISEKLYQEAIGILTVDKAKIARANIIANSYSCGTGCKITLDQMAGNFYVWIIGCGISTIVFTIELVTKNKKRKPRYS